jgi:sulfoxide reductase heme-binding subunit YedZ
MSRPVNLALDRAERLHHRLNAAVQGAALVDLTWPWQDRSGRFSPLKGAMFALMFLPSIWIIHQVWTRQFGPFPLAGMTYWSGVWATAVLLGALAVTPAATIFRWRQLVVVRRMIGVTALIYTIAHIIIYFALRLWDFGLIANEMVTRLTLIIATISTLGLIPLGVTSFDAAVKRMGAEGWARLHNTVYVLTLLALVHYLLSPGVYASQYLMSGMFFWLMGWRWLQKRGQGTDVRPLALLAVTTAVFTALLEAFWEWIYQDFDPGMVLGANFNLTFGVSPAWWNLTLGLLIAAIAARRHTPRFSEGQVS